MSSVPTLPPPAPAERVATLDYDGRAEGNARFDAAAGSAGDLRGRSVRGGAVTFASQAARFVLKMGSTAVLARLLVPADFGLVAMVTVVTGFVELFKDAGLSMATVQRKTVSHEQISVLFWINVALSAAITAIIAGLAPVLAWFYGKPEILPITLALAGGAVLSGLGVQHRALLQRRMEFARLAAVEVGSMAAGVGVAVVMATRGWSYWALVGMTLSTAASGAILSMALSGWWPGLPRRGSGAMPMLKFGGNLVGFSFVNYFGRNGDNFLLGRFAGAADLGIYSKAYGLMLLPLQQINAPVASVTIPALSRLQDEPDAFARFYCQAIRLVAYITMPIVVVLAVLSREVVAIVLGPGWGEAAPVFAVLSLFGVIQPVSVTTGWVLTALGRPQRLLRWSLVGTPCILIAFVCGLPWGPFGVATAAVICAFVLVGPQMAYAYHGTPVRLAEVGRAVTAPLLMSLALAAACLLGRHLLLGYHDALRALVVCLASLLLYAGYFLVLPGPRRDAKQLVATFREGKRLKKGGKT